ncbi:MAG: putative integral membrane protein (TIGR00697 family), partial [Sphingomonas echinoides]
ATPRIWFGGIVAYGISQTLNVTIFSWLKRAEGGGLLWLRAGIASVLSQIVDTLLFVSIAFWGVFPIGSLLAGQMLAKVTLSAILVPPLIYLAVGIGRRLDR